MSCGTAAIATDLTALSISALVQTTSLGAEQQIVAKINAAATAGWVFVIDADGTVQFFAFTNSTSVVMQTSTALVASRWYHIGYRQTAMLGVSGDILFNGVSQPLGFNTPGTGAYLTDAAANLSIAGRDFDTAGLIGVIDDVRLFNRTLAVSEMAMLASPSFLAIAA